MLQIPCMRKTAVEFLNFYLALAVVTYTYIDKMTLVIKVLQANLFWWNILYRSENFLSVIDIILPSVWATFSRVDLTII